MYKQRAPLFFVFLLSFILLSGCVSSRSGKVYSRDQARTGHEVSYGTITDIQPVTIEGTQSGVGAAAGGVAGGVLGSLVGGGRGRVVGGVVGALGGAAGGAVAEEAITKKNGMEITLRMDSGKIIAVVQESDTSLHVGNRVRLLRGHDGTMRVRP